MPEPEDPDLQKEELLLRVRVAHPSSPMTPIPNNYSGYPRRSRSCNPESRWYNNPNNLSTYPRSPNWRPRSPIPNPEYPEYFPAGRADARPRQAIQLFCWGFTIGCYWDLFGFYGIFCWCNVNHTIFSTIHKFLQLFYDLVTSEAIYVFVGYMATGYH